LTHVAPLLQSGRRVLYLGDFDWQGGQIEKATRERLEACRRARVGAACVHRVQVLDHNLARLAIRKEGRRYRKDSPHRFHDAVETEALCQSIIVGTLRDRLDELLPEPLRDVLERERQERDELLE
jgi:hypothetical protein